MHVLYISFFFFSWQGYWDEMNVLLLERRLWIGGAGAECYALNGCVLLVHVLYLGVRPLGVIPNMTGAFMNCSPTDGKSAPRDLPCLSATWGHNTKTTVVGSWEFPICSQVGQKLCGNLLVTGIWSEGQPHGAQSPAG